MTKFDFVILGGGESGVGAALLAQKKGYKVFVSDYGIIESTYKNILVTRGIDFEENKHSAHLIYKTREVIKSPGIPQDAEILCGLRERKIPVISEIEFASRFTAAFLVAITGSNGKTTTTKLITHLLLCAGLTVKSTGNIGNSFAADILNNDKDIYVIELSSFQLEDVIDFHPDVAILLNVTPDHLDRYKGDIRAYAAAKFNIQKNLRTKDLFITNASDIITEDLLEKREKRDYQLLRIEMPSKVMEAVIVEDSSYNLTNKSLQGRHNAFNSIVAITVARRLGLTPKVIQLGLDSFVNDAHRLEIVAEWKGIVFINDSKATNTDAVFYALEAMDSNVVWIAGGVDKGNDYSVLDSLVSDKVKALIALGNRNDIIIDHFSPFVKRIVDTNSMQQALLAAIEWATSGDVILLSPACASFDLFDNYKHRGELFKTEIEKLTN